MYASMYLSNQIVKRELARSTGKGKVEKKCNAESEEYWERLEAARSKLKNNLSRLKNSSKVKEGRSKREKRTKKRTHSLIYACVGKSTGSHPILMALVGWYTRIQSIRIVVGNVRCSKSTLPKLFDSPKFAIRYCRGRKRKLK